jgi:phosphomannomutase
MKSLMVFDLDGTLAKSKSPLETDMADLLDNLMGGASSIDVTRPGVDKACGIHKLQEVLGIPIKEMIFVGDALFPGGNDEPARKAGATCIKVRDPEETGRVIEAVIACVGG